MRRTTRVVYGGDRCRTDSGEMSDANYQVERRDLRSRITVFGQRRRYQIHPLWDLATEEEKRRFLHAGRHWRKSLPDDKDRPIREFKIHFAYEPTGDQRTIHGLPAKRWLILRREEHDDPFGGRWTEQTTEAWYLDFESLESRFPRFSRKLVRRGISYMAAGGERAVITRTGENPKGICAESASTTRSLCHLPDGQVREDIRTSTSRIASMTEQEFPATFFGPPRGFRELPAYPSRWTMLHLEIVRRMRILRYRLSSAR